MSANLWILPNQLAPVQRCRILKHRPLSNQPPPLASTAHYNFPFDALPHAALCLCIVCDINARGWRPLWMMFIAPLWLAADCFYPAGMRQECQRESEYTWMQGIFFIDTVIKTSCWLGCTAARGILLFDCSSVKYKYIDYKRLLWLSAFYQWSISAITPIKENELCYPGWCSHPCCFIFSTILLLLTKHWKHRTEAEVWLLRHADHIQV